MNLSVHEEPRMRGKYSKSTKCETLGGSPQFKPKLTERNSIVILPGVWTTLAHKKEIGSTTAISSELLTVLKWVTCCLLNLDCILKLKQQLFRRHRCFWQSLSKAGQLCEPKTLSLSGLQKPFGDLSALIWVAFQGNLKKKSKHKTFYLLLSGSPF